jgi:hypothetical protein
MTPIRTLLIAYSARPSTELIHVANILVLFPKLLRRAHPFDAHAPIMVIPDPSGWAWVLSVIGSETQVA